jgi:hypothetical protein
MKKRLIGDSPERRSFKGGGQQNQDCHRPHRGLSQAFASCSDSSCKKPNPDERDKVLKLRLLQRWTPWLHQTRKHGTAPDKAGDSPKFTPCGCKKRLNKCHSGQTQILHLVGVHAALPAEYLQQPFILSRQIHGFSSWGLLEGNSFSKRSKSLSNRRSWTMRYFANSLSEKLKN